jgi:hypothetical protein
VPGGRPTVADMRYLGIVRELGTDGVARIEAEIEAHRQTAHSPCGLRRVSSLRLVPGWGRARRSERAEPGPSDVTFEQGPAPPPPVDRRPW